MSINQSSAAVLANASSHGQSASPTILTADSGATLHVPGGNFLLTADFHRVGGDLLLVGKDGHEVLIRHYFDSHNPPDLQAGTGGVIHPDLAARLAGAVAPGQWAQQGDPAPQLHAIGEVKNLSGAVKVHHVDGRVESLQPGATVYQGDVLETAGDGSVGIVFADRSTFSLGKNGRMVMDELVYDPQSHTGHSSLSVVQGSFSFVSGQIAKAAPDAMSVKTPVMTIGIRGTTVAGHASAEGSDNSVVLLSDADGGVGQIVISNQSGSVQVLSEPNQALQIASAFDTLPLPVVMPAYQLQQMIPGFLGVQQNRPSAPTSDPVIHSDNSNQGSTGSGDTPQLTISVDPVTETQNQANQANSNTASNTSNSTSQVTQAANDAVNANSGSSSSSSSDASGQSTVLTTTTLTTTTLTVEQTYETNSTLLGGDPYYTLIAGSADKTLTETLPGSSSLDLQHTSWTIIGGGNAASILLPESTTLLDYAQDTSLGTDVLYARTVASPDSSSPTLSLANDSHGATVLLGYDSVNLMTVESNGYLKNTEAYGFHRVTGSSGDDLFDFSSGVSLTINGGSGDDTLQLENSATVNMSSSALSGTSALTLVNVEHVSGSSGADTFLMGTTAETISGNGGVDLMSFQNVSQAVTVTFDDSGANTAQVGAAADLFSGISVVTGGSGADVFTAASGAVTLSGGAGNDTFTPGSGNSTMDGGAGIDTLDLRLATSDTSIQLQASGYGSVSGGDYGAVSIQNFEVVRAGSGNDQMGGTSANETFDGGAGTDTIDYTGITSALTVNLNGTATGAGIGTDSLINIEVAMGGQGGNIMTAAASGSTLIGNLGADTFIGGAGNDSFDGGLGQDIASYRGQAASVSFVLVGSSVISVMGTSVGTDIMANVEVVIGGSGADLFTVNDAGSTTLDGGLGTDTVDFSNLDGAVSVALNGSLLGTATGSGLLGYSYSLTNIEVVNGTQYNDLLTADGKGDSLFGGDGNDTLIGGAGNDSLVGGLGQDIVSYAGQSASVTVNLLTGTARGSSIGTDHLSGFEVVLGGSGADSLTADNLGDSLYGGAGNDRIGGGLGNDLLDGGAGTDILDYSAQTSALSVILNDSALGTAFGDGIGTDALYNFEVLLAGSGNDVIQAGTGAETIDGGAGTDSVSFASESSGVTANLSTGLAFLAGGVTDKLLNIEILVGSSSADTLIGGSGNETFIGGAGNDVINGGAGRDTVDYSDTSNALTVMLNGASTGTAMGAGIGTDSLQNIEVVLGGSGGDSLYADNLGDSLYGGAGDDLLVGGSGNDRLDGGAGTDQIDYHTQTSSLTVVLNGASAGTAMGTGIGTDILYNFEALTGGAGNDTLSGGNSTVNLSIYGGAGNDTISGGAGNDMLKGDGGVNVVDYSADTNALYVALMGTSTGTAYGAGVGTDALHDFSVVVGGQGGDTIVGDDLGDTLVGGSGNDVITGGTSNDLIKGGLGFDSLDGGAGSDTLDYSAIQMAMTIDLGEGVAEADSIGSDIANFEVVKGSALYANTLISGSADSTLIGGSANDVLDGSGAGNDSLNGGAGTNILHYENTDSGVSVVVSDTALISGTVTGSSSGTDSFTNIERYVGTSYADSFQILASDTQLLKSSTSIDGGAGNDRVFVDTTGGLTVSLSSSGGSIVAAAGGTISLLNVEQVAGGLGADILSDSNGSHVLAGGWMSQSDVDALADAATVALTDSSGSTALAAANFETVSGNGAWLTYEDANHDVYRVSLSGSSGVAAQTALLMTPEASASDGFALADDGRSALYNESLSLYFYNADSGHVTDLGDYASGLSAAGVFALSGDGAWAAYMVDNNSDYGIALVNTRTGAQMLDYDWGSTAISKLALADSGRELFVLSGGTLSLVDVENDGYSASGGATVDTGVSDFSVDSDGGKLIYNTTAGLYYAVLSGGAWTSTLLAETGDAGTPSGVISGNGRFIAYWSDNTQNSQSTPIIYDTLTGTTVALGSLAGDLNGDSLTFSDDGHYLYVTTDTGVISEVNPYFTGSASDANTLMGGSGADTLIGGLDISSTSLLSVSNASGNPSVSIHAGNTLIAGSGTMVMIGGGGSTDFVLKADSLGAETIVGGGLAENQVLNLSAVTANLTVDLGSALYDETANQLILAGSSGNILATDTISGIGNVIGGAGATSVLIGNQDANTMVAGSGANTTFVGHGGADQIYFGAHTNLLVLTDDYHAETVHFDNSSTAKEYIEAEGEVDLLGAAKVSNDLVLYFTGESGGGSLTLADYFLASNSNVLVEIQDDSGGVFVRTNGETAITAHLTSSLGSVTMNTLIAGTTGSDLILADKDHMLLLGSSAALSSSTSSSHGDDFFIDGKNEVVIGASGDDDTAYYSLRDGAITADLSAGYTLSLNLSGSNALGDTSTHVLTGVNLVTASGSSDYLYSIDEIVGTNYGDTLIGGHYSSASGSGGDVTFKVGTGGNTVVNVGAIGNGAGSVVLSGITQTMAYFENTGVLVDYSASADGITADLALSNSGSYYTETLGSGWSVEIAQSGSVVHDGVTDTLFGVTDIRGSAYNDDITLSLSGSYVQSSKGNDSYYAMASNNSIDYSDAVGGALINLSGGTVYLNWTLADGTTVEFTLGGDGYSGTVLHDYSSGAFYTDYLYSYSGSFTDIHMSNDGGALIGDGWTSGTVTMDLQGLDSATGALIDIAGNGSYGVVSGWNGTSTILFSDVAVIKGTGGNDTFVLSDDNNPVTLIGGGGTDALDVGAVGWHSWNGSDTIQLDGLGETVVLSGISTVLHEIVESDSSLLLNDVSGETAHQATLYLADGQVLWSDGTLYSIDGSLAALRASGSIVGATAGDLIVASTADLAGISSIDGNSTNATLELTNATLALSLDLSAYGNYSNIEVLQIDGKSSGVTLGTAAAAIGVTELMIDLYYLEQGTSFTTTLTDMTLYLGGGQNASTIALNSSSLSNVDGFADIAVGTFTYHSSSGNQTYNADSVVVDFSNWAALAGIHTLDLSAFGGYSTIDLSSYNMESLTVVGAQGIDLISVDLASGDAGTYVLEGGASDVVYVDVAASLLTASVDGNGHAVISSGAIDQITLEGIHLVQTTTSEVLVMGNDSNTVSLDLAIGETLTYIIAGTQETGILTAQADAGTQTVTFGGDYTAYLSVGYDPGYDSADATTGNGDHVVGTATLNSDVDLSFGSHLNMDVFSASSHDLMDMNGYGFDAAGGDLKILAEAGTTLSTYSTMTLITNMLSDTGSFAHITGLDSYAADGVALSLSYSDSSVLLESHYAYSTTSSYYGGNGNDEYIVGGHGDQTLSGGGGADEILAVSGNDTVIVGDNSFTYLDGGSGSSKLSFAFDHAATIDLTGEGVLAAATTTGGTHRADSVEHFDMLDLTCSSSSTLVLNEDSVYSASNDSNSKLTSAGVSAADASHALIIGGTSGDVLDLTHDSAVGGSGWTAAGTTTLTVDGASHSYQVYTSTIHGVTEHLYVDASVTVHSS